MSVRGGHEVDASTQCGASASVVIRVPLADNVFELI